MTTSPLPEERRVADAIVAVLAEATRSGVAFAAGSALAKLIDWRGHAHPRR